MWQILTTQTFDDWFANQDQAVQDKILAHFILLQEFGAGLGRPYADTLYGSSHSNMKELRIQIKGEPYRAFYAFDPIRCAIVLCCGNKAGDKRFYDVMIPLADKLYQAHLDELEKEKP